MICSCLISNLSIFFSQTDSTFNPWYSSDSANIVLTILGTLFIIVALAYTTFSTGSGSKSKKQEKYNSEVDPSESVPYSFSLFHLVFALGGAYIAMLFTEWNTITWDNNTTNPEIGAGVPSVWVKIVSSWVGIAIYLWTLLAPVLFPNRDFGYNS